MRAVQRRAGAFGAAALTLAWHAPGGTDRHIQLPDLGSVEDLRLIKSFVAVVASGNNFSAAARELSLTPAAVSKNIKRLEEQLAVRLFYRTTRALKLTPEGQLIHERYAAALAQLELARELAGEQRHGSHGTVRITLTSSFGRHVVMPLLDQFMRQYPDIRLDVSLSDQLTDMIREGYDVGVRGGPEPDTGSFVIRKLAALQPMVCAAPIYLAQHGEPRHPSELEGHNCIVWKHPETGRVVPWEFRVRGRGLSIRGSGSLICSDLETIADMAVRGVGLAVIASYRAAPLLAQGALQEVLATFRPPPRHFYIHYPNRKFLAQRVRLLVDFLIEATSIDQG